MAAPAQAADWWFFKSHAQRLVEDAQEARRDGNYERAEELLGAAERELDKPLPAIAYERGLIARDHGKQDQALELLTRAADGDPESDARIDAASVLVELGRWPDAVAALRQAADERGSSFPVEALSNDARFAKLRSFQPYQELIDQARIEQAGPIGRMLLRLERLEESARSIRETFDELALAIRFVSRIFDAVSASLVAFVLLALWSLCTVGIGFVGTVAGIFALRLAVGVLEAPSYPVNNRVITAWFPQAERASAAATFLSGQFVGLAFCMPLLAWLQEQHGWRSVFHATGFAGIAWACVWYAVYRDPPGTPSVKARASWRDLQVLLTRRKLWGIYIGQFAVSTTLWFFLTWFPTYLVSYRGMSSMRAGILASVPYIAALVGVLVAGLVSDALLRSGFSLGFARKTPIITGLALAMSIAGASFVETEAGVIAFMATAFFGCGMASITWSVVSAVAPTRLLGLTSGVFNLLGNSAAVVTPLVVGKLAGSSGFAPALLYVAAIAAVGVAAYVLLVGEVAKLPDPRYRRSIVVMICPRQQTRRRWRAARR